MARKLTEQQKKRIQAKQTLTQDEIITTNTSGLIGRVITQHGKHVLIRGSNGLDILANIRQNLGGITTGDLVAYTVLDDGTTIIHQCLPRNNLLSRIGFGGKEKLIAANIDQVMIVIAPKPEPSPSLIDRYIIVINRLNINPILLVNKADLLPQYPLDSLIAEFSAIGYRVLLCSTNTETQGIDELNDALANKTTIFVGQSGVGKSSLTNQLLPNLALRVQAISLSTGLGNHTTSASALYDLPNNNGFIIDSPGVRSFEIDHISATDVDKGFIEIYPHLGQCKFRDCRHLQDPDCIFSALILAGKISRRRLESYLQIKASIKSS